MVKLAYHEEKNRMSGVNLWQGRVGAELMW
jgi:hypothetical protein